MGFIRDIENMPNEYAYPKVFFERWYRPRYTTVIVAGDVTPGARAADDREGTWGGWKSGGTAPPAIPKEPAPKGPLYAHVPWTSETSPWVTVAFPGPAFDETAKDSASMAILGALYFGNTSDLYKKLVVTEQKVDQLIVDVPVRRGSVALHRPGASQEHRGHRVRARPDPRDLRPREGGGLSAQRVADAKSFNRYSLSRSIDSTERVAAVVASYISYKRSYQTVNGLPDARLGHRCRHPDRRRQVFHGRGPDCHDAVAGATAVEHQQGTGARLVPRRQRPPTPRAARLRALPSRLEPPPVPMRHCIQQKSVLPQLEVTLLFSVGSAHDPAGKEGLAALTAAMLTGAGSRSMTIEQIDAALYPTAASFTGRVDKEMTSLRASVHRDRWQTFVNVALPQLVDPGWRAGGLRAHQDSTAQRARPGPPLQQRGGARQRAAADQHLPRHAVRTRGTRHRRRHQRDHAGRREGVRAADVPRART